MAMISGAVALVWVERSQAFVFLHDPSNTGPLPTGAILWSDSGPPREYELVTRSMWLSLINRSLAEHRSVSIGIEDTTGLVTLVMLSDTVVEVGRSALPRDAAEREQLVDRFIRAATRSRVAASA